MYVAKNSGLGDFWGDLATNLPGILTGAGSIVQATRPPSPTGTTPVYSVMPSAVGVSPGGVPPGYYQPQQQSSFLSDPLTLGMIALAGVAVLMIAMKR